MMIKEGMFANFAILRLSFALKFTPQKRNTFALYYIFAGVYPLSPFLEENSVRAASRSYSTVYVCDNVKIRDLGRAIFEFI